MGMPVQQIASVWINAGGSRSAVVVACAVALAESGGNQYAISPSLDYGLWQINDSNFGWTGLNWGNWWDPYANARAAIRMSGNGTNWAAWCTMWSNPAVDCGHGFINWPESGSAASRTIFLVQLALQIFTGVIPPPLPPTASEQEREAWNNWVWWHTAGAHGTWSYLNNLRRWLIGALRW